MIKQLAHLCINAADLDATTHFYCDVLGLERAFDFEKEGELFGYYLKLGANTFIEVFRGEPGPANGNIKHLAIEVDSIDEVMKALHDNDIEVTEKKFGADRAWQVWASDPNGVRIEFHEYAADAMQLVGGICRI